VELHHPPDPIHFPLPPTEELNLEERRRGEFIHRVLFFVDWVDERTESEIDGILRRVNDELKTDYSPDFMKGDLLEFLSLEAISPYFRATPGRTVQKEQEFSDSRGTLFRMDRVVFEGDRISVVDYKTGTDRKGEEEYFFQINNYMRMLKEIYPEKRVEGVIAYVDLKEIIRVK
jgi:ATP-dependent exoDNAse (exonuclease V) beta subunit